ncbi:protein FLOURY 1-like [Salvia splendens]|uniref:protein FLOURY 1-like n=1 Tax=Salvia splendens TaxID=180675 RepID=UPI001C266236|nr:protein FLOURY 1-like [Salvia splendens]
MVSEQETKKQPPMEVIDAKLNQKSDGKHASVSERKRNCDSEVSALRKLVKMERRRADAALAEVERERAASAMTAKEAMEMIQRLQHEKNSIEMAADQQRRLSEAKHVHDEEVIQSLESLLWSYEEELGLLRQQLGPRRS